MHQIGFRGGRGRVGHRLDDAVVPLKVSYTLRASSVINPFRRDALEQFRCPARL
ncbi:TPA: hypothetical protein SMR42_001515 [Pseudomonas putida]|nr:hypothetical protein [Pseudomonas putida]